jgi:hypothetical protein
MIYRRFGYVQARLLLETQEELRKLESKLDDFDAEMDANKNEKILRSGFNRMTDENVQRRKAIMDDLRAKFCDYGESMANTGLRQFELTVDSTTPSGGTTASGV